jgi:pilus assembly protein CpaE
MLDTIEASLSQTLSVALIVPHAGRRLILTKALADSKITVAREFVAYPSRTDVLEIAGLGCGAVVVDLDDDAGNAVRAIQSLTDGLGSMTVMAYSSRNDPSLIRLSMEAGAREFLLEPLQTDLIHEALARAISRCNNRGTVPGKVILFLPSKGGVGVTTLALNFALALKKESNASVVLVDLDYELGEIALGLGITPQFSVLDALRNPARLDREFLLTLLARHSSGVAILGAAEEYGIFHSGIDGAEKLFRILRSEFTYVVVDGGTTHSYIQKTLFHVASTLYLVTDLTFPAVRNARRIVTFLSGTNPVASLEVVVNRSTSHHLEIDERAAVKAMGRPISWRVPNCYAAARVAQDTGVPLVTEDNPITRVLIQMADAVCGRPPIPEKKKPFFNFLGLGASAERARS